MLHGRVIAGLLAFQIEQDHGHPDLLPARLTVDMYRPPDFSPIVITTKVVRDGYRIKVVDAEFLSGGRSVARATCQLLRRTENSPGNIWKPENWSVPSPEACGPDQRLATTQSPLGAFAISQAPWERTRSAEYG